MEQLLLVCAGGAIGSGARYLASTWVARTLGPDFPRGTLLVNVIGSFALAAVLSSRWGGAAPDLRIFLGAGVLGGFTTYSSFNYETIALVERGDAGLAAVNVGLTLGGCFLAGIAGLALGRGLAG